MYLQYERFFLSNPHFSNGKMKKSSDLFMLVILSVKNSLALWSILLVQRAKKPFSWFLFSAAPTVLMFPYEKTESKGLRTWNENISLLFPPWALTTLDFLHAVLWQQKGSPTVFGSFLATGHLLPFPVSCCLATALCDKFFPSLCQEREHFSGLRRGEGY